MSYDWRDAHFARHETERRLRKMPMARERLNWRGAAMQASAIIVFGAVALHGAWVLCRLVGGWM